MTERAGDRLVREVLDRLPGVARWHAGLGSASIAEAVEAEAGRHAQGARISPRLALRMERMTARLLGADVAAGLARRLAATPSVLVANHHGINTHPEFAQATLLSALPEIIRHAGPPAPAEADTAPPEAIPVLACSTIALRSYSFPRGLLLGRQDARGAYVRLPLFPEALGDVMTHAAPALTAPQVAQAMRQWSQRRLAQGELAVARHVAERFLLAPDVLELPRFADQATVVNARLWRELFAESGPPPPALAYLDMEEIVRDLLIEELEQEDSLFSFLLGHAPARRMLHGRLQGVPGCWTDGGPAGGNAGTAFFWLVSPQGRRCRLTYEESPAPCLRHKDITISLEPETLIQALRQGTLVPGLFCSCVLLSQVHGLFPLGGMYMLDYLPRMLGAVREVAVAHGRRDLVRTDDPSAPCCALGSVFMPLHHEPEGERRPAGMLEMLRAGTACTRALPMIATLSAREAFRATAALWYQECVPESDRSSGWRAAADSLLNESAGYTLA